MKKLYFKIKRTLFLIKMLFKIFNRKSFIEFKKIRKAKKHGYYENINELPVFNWFEITKGNYRFIHRNKKIKTYPRFFVRIYENMLYQFEDLDNTKLRKLAELTYLKSLHQTSKDVKFLNIYNTKKAQFEKANNKPKKAQKINDITTFIEEVFENIGTIDIYKISTARYFSLYNRAVKKIEQKNSIKRK